MFRRQVSPLLTPGIAAPEAAPAPAPFAAERRREKRTRVLKAADLILDKSCYAIHCLILNESPSGAMLETPVVVTLPPTVTLQMSDGALLHGTVRWVKDRQAGIEFMGPRGYGRKSGLRMRLVEEVLQQHPLEQALQILRATKLFDDEELAEVAAFAAPPPPLGPQQ